MCNNELFIIRPGTPLEVMGVNFDFLLTLRHKYLLSM